MTRSRGAGLLLLAALLTGGCAGPASSATTSAGSAATGLPTPTVDGSASADSSASPTIGELPPVPAGFPVMDGMQPVEPDEPDVIAAWRTDANGAQVFAFYEDQLAAAGYQIDLAGPGGAVAVFRFTPPDADQLQIDLYGEEDGTRIQLRLPHP